MNDNKEKIEEKIKRLKEYCQKHPYAISNIKYLKDILEREGRVEEVEYLNRLYNDYKYISSRKSQGKISKELEDDLREAKIGGIFGFSEQDEKIAKILPKDYFLHIMEQYGSINNFRERYIQYRVDLAIAKNVEEKEMVKSKYEKDNIIYFSHRLPIVREFDLCGKEGYKELLYRIIKKSDYDLEGYIIGNEMDKTIDLILSKLPDDERKIIEMRFGLKDGQSMTYRSIGEKMGVTQTAIRGRENEILKELRKYQNSEMLNAEIFEVTEEFIRAYYEKYDIFYSNEQKKKEDIEELMKIARKNPLRTTEEPREICKLNLSPRISHILAKNGFFTVDDLLEKVNSIVDFEGIVGLGEKGRKELENCLHGLGIKFTFERQREDNKQEKQLSELNFSARVENALKRARISSLSDLLETMNRLGDLKKIRGLGEKGVEEITDKMHQLGIKCTCEDEKERTGKEEQEVTSNLEKEQEDTNEEQEELEIEQKVPNTEKMHTQDEKEMTGKEEQEVTSNSEKEQEDMNEEQEKIEIEQKAPSIEKLHTQIEELSRKSQELSNRLREIDISTTDKVGDEVIEEFLIILDKQKETLEQLDNLTKVLSKEESQKRDVRSKIINEMFDENFLSGMEKN